jgi:CARDB protein
MRTMTDTRTRRLATVVAVLAGSVALSACGSPVAPTAVETEAATAAVNEAGKVSKSGTHANLLYCRPCPSAIDPVRVPPNVPESVTPEVENNGDAPAPTMHVALALVAANGRRIPVGEADQAAPRPGEHIALRLTLVVPARTPAGSYGLELVLDPDNRIAESDETDNAAIVGIVVVGL